jgi:flagellar protein FliS
MQRAAQVYLETQVTTTSQGQILVMLYEGAIKFLVQARERMAARDYAAKGILISKALDVINELDASLNVDKGGDLAVNLHQLYFYCTRRLFVANSKMDPEPLGEVIKILGGLRGAYAEIMDTPEAVAASRQAAATAAARGTAQAPARTPPAAGGTQAAQGVSQRARSAYAMPAAAAAQPKIPAPETAVPAAQSRIPAGIPEKIPQPAAPTSSAPLPDEALLSFAELPPPASKRLAASSLYGKFASRG